MLPLMFDRNNIGRVKKSWTAGRQKNNKMRWVFIFLEFSIASHKCVNFISFPTSHLSVIAKTASSQWMIVVKFLSLSFDTMIQWEKWAIDTKLIYFKICRNKFSKSLTSHLHRHREFNWWTRDSHIHNEWSHQLLWMSVQSAARNYLRGLMCPSMRRTTQKKQIRQRLASSQTDLFLKGLLRLTWIILEYSSIYGICSWTFEETMLLTYFFFPLFRNAIILVWISLVWRASVIICVTCSNLTHQIKKKAKQLKTMNLILMKVSVS